VAARERIEERAARRLALKEERMSIPQRLLTALRLAPFAVLLSGLLPGQAQTPGDRFSHSATRFPLSGAHEVARCESCHVQGVFRGLPTQCSVCHARASRTPTATPMPPNHVPTAQPCELCHTTSTFAGARFRHVGIAPGSCMSCHNGTVASGKSPNHMVTSASCDSCHRTTAWLPAAFNHANVAPGTCMSCHNGTQATGKPANHVVASASCDSCHRTTAWIPAAFNHANVAPGTCATCHNGTQARGKSANHIVTTASCDTCHRTTAWIPATFSHTGVAPGTCATCHNGTQARGKSTTHMVTTRACDACHGTTAWIPATYTHLTPAYKPHGASVTCLACHKANTEVATWTFAAYKPDCAGCHAGNFKQGPHKKVESPLIYYTVAELKDCSGSCHVYTNSTFTTILKARSGKHRSTAGGF
jgi:hypothetical protein